MNSFNRLLLSKGETRSHYTCFKKNNNLKTKKIGVLINICTNTQYQKKKETQTKHMKETVNC